MTNISHPQKTINKMAISTYISIITLNVNGLNAPIKRHSIAEQIKKDPSMCCLQGPTSGTHTLKVEGWKQIFHANGK